MTTTTETERVAPRTRRITSRRIIGWIVMVALASCWWSFLRPSSMGGPLTVIMVTGQSMEPGLHTDDVAVMYDRDHYQAGDVVAFRSTGPDGFADGPYVIHRIKAGNGNEGYVMRGDNNEWDDPWTPTDDDVAGEMLFSVPGVGTAMRWISTPFHLATLLASIAIAMVVAGPSTKPSEGDQAMPASCDTGAPVDDLDGRRASPLARACALGIVLYALTASAPGSAATLDVDGGVAQSWEFNIEQPAGSVTPVATPAP